MTTPQSTLEWTQARLGFVTGSRFCDVLTNARSGNGISKTAESYLIDLLGEHLTRLPASELKTYAMEWGERWEPVARATYQQATKSDVQEVGFVPHPTERFVGCSPDSFVGSDGLIEIKCPLTAANHVRVLLSGKVPDEHTEQIQGGMWVTGRQWCDFVSYHDRFPLELRMAVIRVERDQKSIDQIAEKVLAFRDEMVKRLESILSMWKEKVAA